MADYYDDGSGGLGGLGGSLNSFLTNPLTLMSLKMMANNSPRIGQPVNTLEGTSDLLLKAGTIQKAQQDDALKKRAMMQALIDAGIDPAQAKMYAQNPEAGKLAINQLTARQQRAKQQAWEAEAKASQLDVSPDQTDNQTDDGEDGSPNVQAPGPQTDATPQLDTTPQSAQLDTTPQIDTSSFLPPNTGPKTADAIAAYTKAAYAQQPQGPETVKALAERARLATAETAGKPQAQTLQDYPDQNRGAQAQAAPDYADQSQGAQAQNLPYQAQAQQKLTEPITLSDANEAQPQAGAQYAEARGPTPAPAQESAQQRQKALEQHIPAGILQWLQLPSDTSVRAKDQPPQQKDQTQFVTQAQPQAPAPQQQAPQQQAPATPQQQAPAPQPNATERALAVRQQAKTQQIDARIRQINGLLASPYATQHGAEALKLELGALYKQKAVGSKWQWGKIGSGLEGDVMGWINTDTQQIKEYKPAGGAASGSTTEIYNKIEDLQTKGLPPDQIADQVLPPSAKQYVKAILRGDALPGNMGRVAGTTRSEYLKLAHAIDPNFNEAQIPMRQTFARNMASSAPNSWGTQVRSSGTIVEHLAAALDNLDVVQKGAKGVPGGEYGDIALLNQARAVANRNAKDENYNKAEGGYDLDKDAVAGEVVRLLTNGQGSEKDRAEWRDKFDYTKHPISKVRGAWNEAYTIMHGRLSKIAEQKDAAYGTETDPMTLLGKGGPELEARIRRQGAAPGTQGGPPAVQWERGPDGKPRRVQQ